MAQDEQQPERPQGGGISRDTLLLLGALAFLIIAVALTFLFTPSSGPNQSLDATTIAQTTAGVALTTQAAAGSPAPTLVPSLSPDSPTTDAYPIGGNERGTVVSTATTVGLPATSTAITPTSTSLATSPGMTLTSTSLTTSTGGLLIPTGDVQLEPSPTVARPAGGLAPTVSTAAPRPSATAGYPGPVGEGTPPPPALNPTVVTPVPAPTRAPVLVITPTIAPPPPSVLVPTMVPVVTASAPRPVPTIDMSLEATATTEPPTPTEGPPPPPPADVLRGNVRWAASQSPITLHRDVQIVPGAELLIEPGVEIRLDPGVSIYVDGGRFLALGKPGQPVRLVGATGARWSGLFGRPASFIVLEQTEVRGGGAGGIVLAVDHSELVVRGSRFNDNGGAILLTETKLEMRDSEVAGNDMPFGPALEASYGRGNFVTLTGNRFGGNRLGDGTPQVRISNSSTFETLNLTIEGNLIRGGAPNLQLATNGPLKGSLLCNSLVGDGMGFGLRTQTPQVKPNGVLPMELRVENNVIDEHIAPVIPTYLRYGLGRGAVSEILLDMRNNWWGESTGPYEPDVNPLGRGDSVGNNLSFEPWLSTPPACAPAR